MEDKRCPKCGAAISPDAPEGLCPACLLDEVSRPTDAGQSGAKPLPPNISELSAAFPQLEILELIGRGGMGFVFRARQPKLDRFIALKILPATRAADPAFAERFSQEGRVLARLNHPNIVTIHDFGQANGFFYLMMEFVEGVNLRQAMQAGRFTPEQALAVVPKICDALEFAHQEGILHRDIKPENILLDGRGRVKIADFGIAKILGTAASASPGSVNEPTDANVTGVIGTPQYMAPEQLENPRKVDQRADVYALGVVFYEMLTGELPLGRFAPPSEKSQADPRLDKVVLNALEKEPERRTPSAGTVKTQVETITSTPPRFAPAPQALQTRPIDWRLHVRRGLRAAAILFFLSLLAAGVLCLILPESYMAVARLAMTTQATELAPYRIQVEAAKIHSDKVLLEAADSLHLERSWSQKSGANMAKSATLERLRSSVVVHAAVNSGLFEIIAYADSPTEAAEIANTVMDTYRHESATKIVVVDPAAIPLRPFRPNRPLILGLGALIGAGLSLLSFIAVGLFSLLRSWLATQPDSASRTQAQAPGVKRPEFRLTRLVLASLGMAAIVVLIGWLKFHNEYQVKRLLPDSEQVRSGKTESAAEKVPDSPQLSEAHRTKTISLFRTEGSAQGDRLSAWTDSPLPAGEEVVALVTHPDGRTEPALTQTITIRDHAGAKTSTVFTWLFRPEFGAAAVDSAQSHIMQNAGRPSLVARQPFELFAITNKSGGIMRGSLEFWPASRLGDDTSGEARVRISSATNVSHLVLAYFTSSVPAGCLLQASATDPSGLESEVHTSVSRGAAFDNENARWDIPQEFDPERMNNAVDQLNHWRTTSLVIPIGNKAPVFSLTNATGGVYTAFIEILAPSADTRESQAISQTENPFVTELKHKQSSLRTKERQLLQVFSESSKTVRQVRAEEAEIEEALRNRQSSRQQEVARQALALAEKELAEAEQRYKLGVIDSLALEKARAARDISQAELTGDNVQIARIKLELAKKEEAIAQKRFEAGATDSLEVGRARLARIRAEAELADVTDSK